MIYIILCVIICFIIGFIDDGFFDGLILAVIGAFIGCLVWLLLGSAIGVWLPTENRITSSECITSLHESHIVEGDFYLGSGTINGKKQYIYSVHNKDGYQLETIDNDKNVILGYDDKNPRIEVKTRIFTNDAWLWFAVPPVQTKTTIYIPKGTIKEDFNIDLK